MRKAVHVDDRNYDREARELVKGLGQNEKYSLYKIVVDKLREYQTDVRERELQAVKLILDKDKSLDKYRLQGIDRGHRSSMANDLNLGDLKANQKSNKRKQ